MNEIGKLLVIGGIALAALGCLLLLLGRMPGAGWLPGDIVIERKSFTFVFPVVTSIVVSVVLTLLINIFFRR